MRHIITHATTDGTIMEQKQSWALVTGGSSGIGYEYACQLALRSYPVFIVSNQEPECIQAANHINRQYGVAARYLVTDLSLSNAAEEVYNFCRQNNMEIEVLVNNAGMFFWSLLHEASPEKILTITQLHVTTPTMLCRLFGNEMRKKQKGYILNVASIAAWMSFPTLATYANSKMYIKNFTLSLHYELKDYNVKVCYIAPGAVDTSLYQLSPKMRNILRKLHIMLSPQEVARKGINALMKGKKRVIPGCINYLFIGLVKICPLGLINIAKRLIYKKNDL